MDSVSNVKRKGRKYELKENDFDLYPVSGNESGKGLPYAPEDWPNPGDKWGWKAGNRIAVSGHFIDRLIYLPNRLHEGGKERSFRSKLSLEQYIRTNYPNADVRSFFSSFSWRIPSKSFKKDDTEIFTPSWNIPNHPTNNPYPNDARCKAGNRVCDSLVAEEKSDSNVMFCDICCSEPDFCRDCCCILCRRTITKTKNGYNYVTCEANIDGCACGHKSHIECALRAYMAGTVGGSIGLDAEYYCRRCDSRTDLVSRVRNLLDNCESIDSMDEIEKVLKVCISVLRGSKRKGAKQLVRQIELAMSKFGDGTYFEDIWKRGGLSAVNADYALYVWVAHDGGTGQRGDEKSRKSCN